MRRNRSRAANAQLPFDLYKGLVQAVYRDVAPLMMGGLLPAVAAAMCAVRMDSAIMAWAAVAITVTFMGRLAGFLRWSRTDFTGWRRQDARKAARTYGIMGCLSAASISAAGFLIIMDGDLLSRFVMFAAVLANVVGTVARNYAFPKLVDAQLVLFLMPPCAAMWNEGSVAVLLTVMSGLAVMTFRMSARDLRNKLVASITQERTARMERDLFDDALASLPVGVMVLDADGRCRVTNHSVVAYAGLDRTKLLGSTVDDIMDAMGATGIIGCDDIAAMRVLFNDHDESIAHHDLTVYPRIGASRSERRVRMTRSVRPDGGSTSIFEDVTARRRAEHAIDRMARFDRLTGLLNREQLTPALLEIARARGVAESGHDHGHGRKVLGLAVIDLIRFERVNAMYGRETGDDTLRAIARAMQEIAEPGDRVLRIGGDRFALAVAGRDTLAVANRLEAAANALVGERLDAAVLKASRTELSAGLGDAVQAAVGTATSAVVDAHDAAADLSAVCRRLIGHADMAIEAAKSRACAGAEAPDDATASVCAWNETVGAAVARQRTLERDVASALERGEFHVQFQPILDRRTGAFGSAEALLRWTHPRLGAIGPGEFVPIAERQGLMSEIGVFVLERATRACAGWASHVGVAVNVSPRQFNAPGLITAVRSALDAAGLDPARLTVEITETVAIADEDAARRALAQLRDLGVRTALDDFGTGHSSLGMLHSLPLDRLKLDRAFVRALGDDGCDMTGRALVTHISRLAHDLGLELVVEGVEEHWQMDALTACADIDHVQGFLYARPLDDVTASAMLRLEARAEAA